MFVITDPTLNRSILLYLVERMEVDPHLLDLPRRRLAREFVNAVKPEQFAITVNFDSAAVMAAFGRLDDITC